MSKFFNQTVKARNLSAPAESIKAAAVDDYQAAAAAPKPVAVELPANPLQDCRRLANPISGILEAQFHGSPTMDSVRESYRGLRTRLLKLQSARNLRSILVTSAAQADGKTMTSLNLALCCAQLHDTKVLLIDGDIRSRGLSRAFGSCEGYGLADVLAGECAPEKAILATELPNLYVMHSGLPSGPPAELLASKKWQELMAWCGENFKIVLVDSPPVLDLTDVELLSAACDGVLMVVRAQRTKRATLEKSVGRIDAKKLLGVVFNAVGGASPKDNYLYYGAKES